jgi:hypothetical protein
VTGPRSLATVVLASLALPPGPPLTVVPGRHTPHAGAVAARGGHSPGHRPGGQSAHPRAGRATRRRSRRGGGRARTGRSVSNATSPMDNAATAKWYVIDFVKGY